MAMNNEPVAWLINGKLFEEYFRTSELDKIIPLYTHPANLTDEEITEIANEYLCYILQDYETTNVYEFARAILRKAQEK